MPTPSLTNHLGPTSGRKSPPGIPGLVSPHLAHAQRKELQEPLPAAAEAKLGDTTESNVMLLAHWRQKSKPNQAFVLKTPVKSQTPCFYAGLSDKDLKPNWPQALSANPNSLCCPRNNLLLYLDTPRWDVTSFLSPCPWVSQTPPRMTLMPTASAGVLHPGPCPLGMTFLAVTSSQVPSLEEGNVFIAIASSSFTSPSRAARCPPPPQPSSMVLVFVLG